jgi:hypothetical protein
MLVFVGGLLATWGIFLLGHRRRHVGQYNNYAAGHFLDESVSYNFNYRFYPSFEHIFNPMRKKVIERTEQGIANFVKNAGEAARRLYSGSVNAYAAYILAALVVAALLLWNKL